MPPTNFKSFDSVWSLGDFEQGLRVFGGKHEQCSGGSRGRPTTLLPILQGAHRDTEQLGKSRLRQTSLLSNRPNVRNIGHAAVLAAFEFSKTSEDFLADIATPSTLSSHLQPLCDHCTRGVSRDAPSGAHA